ncbi:ornithine carbamoyltransferase [Ilyobacter polytropus]|uniref:Ornithine carbamoyltransferase n=1 Tax=Ilyobacter polytropus (strain ATCC 51220 / DSM 2926 / LMG 16218 / CuHBu1) TaxID=572544 RepID=E3HC18_ILYPC|nr:ornithine carbamoyltransferase [Ilyobacter polytropus]ADO84344.1 ornithine carbamoyltransferase [Ilyobacter polytropus DSM 2926]
MEHKHFLKLLDFKPEEIQELLDLSKKLKDDKKSGKEDKKLMGKNIALIFEKDSTRTRCSFEVAAYDQGAHVTYLGPSGSQIGKKESIKDTARVLGRMFDAIEYRGYGQKVVEELAEHSGVSVWNGLTTEFHPTQILADFMTILEHKGKLQGVKLVYMGDGRNNMGNSLMVGAAKMGMDFRIVGPKSLFPTQKLINQCLEISKLTGAKLTFTESVEEGLKDADAVYTDVWVSMGEPDKVWEERIEFLKPYQVNSEAMSHAKDDAIFLHCLPAFHDLETSVGRDIFDKFAITEMEVSDEVFEGPNSVVFDQAENRLHTIKAVMVATLGR